MIKRPVSHLVDLENSPSQPSFKLPDQRQYDKQYANIYWLRLVHLRPRVLERAKIKFQKYPEPAQYVKRVLDVEQKQLSYIIGTVFVDMPLKPNVLEDLSRDQYIIAPPPQDKMHSPKDEVMLEDESGRVRLTGPVILDKLGHFVTGTIMAVLGYETRAGDFRVIDYCYAGVPKSESSDSMQVDEEDEYIVIASGLSLGDGDVDNELRVDLFSQWLQGELGSETDREEAFKITRLILAGNSLVTTEKIIETSKAKRLVNDNKQFSTGPAAQLDTFLSELLPTISIDIISGAQDPCPPTLPQPPMHRALFTQAKAFPNFSTKSNPVWFGIGNKKWLGTAGQNIDDIYKYLDEEDRLEMARNTMNWSHIAPTCPDTLWCYPFVDHDPFLLQTCPDVYFIANQPSFGFGTIEREDGKPLSIILIPKFNQTGEVVIINNKTGRAKTMRFDF